MESDEKNQIGRMLFRLPLPITAVALSIASLGNLLEAYSESVRLFCGALAFLLILAFTAKILIYPERFREDMKKSGDGQRVLYLFDDMDSSFRLCGALFGDCGEGILVFQHWAFMRFWSSILRNLYMIEARDPAGVRLLFYRLRGLRDGQRDGAGL